MPDRPQGKSPDGSHTDAAREAERLDQIAHEDALTGGAPGGVTEEDAINVAKDQRIRDGEIFARPEIDPPTSLDLPPSGPDPEESVLEDLGPDEAHNAMLVGMFSGGGQSVDDVSRGADQPKPGGGMQQIDPPATAPDGPPSDPGDTRSLNSCLLFSAATGLTLAGILIFLWAFTGGRTQTEFGVIRSEPLATFTLTPRPATATPTPRPVTPLTAGPIVATQPGTTTVYRVEGVTGDGVRYTWSHSATCGQHAGEDTASYSWDHPHQGRQGDCPQESVHPGLVMVRITDAHGQTITREYTRGSAEGRGTVPAGGGAVGATSAPSGVTRSATASLSFTRVTGPTNLARVFTDRFALKWNGIFDLVQLSNNHTATGTRTGNSFVARGTDGQEYRGAMTESGGAATFQGQLLGPNGSYVYNFNGETVGPITTSTPAAAASPTAAAAAPTGTATATATAAASTGGTQSDPNYPLAGAGLLAALGGLGLGYGGRKYGLRFPMPWPPIWNAQEKQKDPCDDEKRREAQARARRDAARQKYQQLEDLRAEHERARRELMRSSRALDPVLKDDPGATVRRNTLRNEQAAVEAARTAYNGAGGDAAHAAAKEELRQAEADWQAADAALRECLRQNPPPPPPAPPTTGGATTTAGGGGAAVAGGDTTAGTGGGTRTRTPQPPTPPAPPAPPAPPPPPPAPPKPPTTGGGVGPETQPRVCKPGDKKDEQISTYDYRIADLRTATIVARHSAMRTEEVPLGQGAADGEGPRGERGSGAFGEVFTYWSNASDIGAQRARGAVSRDSRLQVQGDYSVRYTVHTYTLTCTRWSECNAQGTGWVQRSRVTMAYTGSDEVTTDPPVKAEVRHSDRNTVTREVMRVVQGIFGDLQAQNEAAEKAAKNFTERCK